MVGYGGSEGVMLPYSSPVLSKTNLPGVSAPSAEQWGQPRSGSLNIWVPGSALLLPSSVTLGKSLPPSGPQFLHLKSAWLGTLWPRRAKFHSPEPLNPSLQHLTLSSGSSHCPAEPGHGPRVRLEGSPLQEMLG